MGTVVAIETSGGAAIAGDRLATRGGTVTSGGAERVVDLDEVGGGAVGEQGDVDEFHRRLDSELRSERMEREREIDVDLLARIAARIAEDAGVTAVVSTHDDEGVARIRQVGPDGSVLSGPIVAIGSGAQVALGRLEAAERERDLRSTEELARETIETVAERDTDTGEEVDLWSLPSKEGGDSG